MLQELSTRLTNVIEQRRLKKKLEEDLRAIETEYQNNSSRLVSLSTKLEKEKTSVDKLEKKSLETLFYSMIGKHEQKLEKERQELLSTKLLHQQTKHQVDFLEQEINNLSLQLGQLKNVDSDYQLLLSQKEQLLRQSNQPIAHELIELSEQIANYNSDVNELHEAIVAGKNVVLVIDQIVESLESAENWGTLDVLGGGLIVTSIKHSRIDDARNIIHEVQTKMGQFQRELADVRKNIELKIDIGELTTFADYLFDGFIIDSIVQSKIVDSLDQAKQAKKLISEVIVDLEHLQEVAADKTKFLKEKGVQLIERTYRLTSPSREDEKKNE